MGLTYTWLVYIGICFLFVQITLSKDKWASHQKSRNPEDYPFGIHCRGWGYPEDAETTRSCCRRAHVSCREYKSDHRKKPNCIVYDRREEVDVKDCCLRKMDWAIGRTYGHRC